MATTTVSYRDGLLKRLKDPEYAAMYLEEVIAAGDRKALMIALKDVVDARGGVGALADKVPLQRQSLYKVLSKQGNPTLETLGAILKPLGLRLSVAAA
jgi:probable addiction module antidote protein